MQNFLALVPLALLLGEVTEDLALRFGDVIGGLLVRVAAICGPTADLSRACFLMSTSRRRRRRPSSRLTADLSP